MRTAIDKIKGKIPRIVVIGDIIIDKYVGGAVERMSQEAPVPIVHVKNEKFVLGGAANVAHNVAALGKEVLLIGQVGASAHIIESLCQKANITLTSIVEPNYMSEKTRILGNDQQIVRVDHETVAECNPDMLIEFLGNTLLDDDVLIISDYGKGLLNKKSIEFITTLPHKKIADPRAKHVTFYKGSTLLKPNIHDSVEMCKILGKTFPLENSDENIEAIGGFLHEKLGASIIITRGAKGMSLITENEVAHIPTQAKEVFDVSGAGDTVAAVLGVALAADLSMKESMILGNYAAGIVVGKRGTATASIAEIESRALAVSQKVKTIEEMKIISEELWRQGKKIALTNGCFDLIHAGHVRMLREARSFGDCLVIALNSDESVRRLKGPSRPLINEEGRAEVLSVFDCVDYLVFFDEDTPLDVIKAIRPHVLVKGKDYKVEQIAGHKVVQSYGGEVKLVNMTGGISTSNIIKKILEEQKLHAEERDNRGIYDVKPE
jgi:D-beta-D-heptose 7-phosphate kinase / D-beta-D-heptose 1-phosphate adenosyltransferase